MKVCFLTMDKTQNKYVLNASEPTVECASFRGDGERERERERESPSVINRGSQRWTACGFLCIEYRMDTERGWDWCVPNLRWMYCHPVNSRLTTSVLNDIKFDVIWWFNRFLHVLAMKEAVFCVSMTVHIFVSTKLWRRKNLRRF